MMALYVEPAQRFTVDVQHDLFVLLPPIKIDESHLPEPLVIRQVVLEGKINWEAILEGVSEQVEI
jgi:hypothetical protein